MRLLLEKLAPFIIGTLATILWWYFDCELPSDKAPLLSASLTLGAILTGFLATAKTLLISLHGSEVMQRLRESGYIRELVHYLAMAIWLAFSFSVLALVGMVLTRVPTGFDELWLFFAVSSATAFVRVTNVTFKILTWE